MSIPMKEYAVRAVDKNLQTRLEQLSCCGTSAVPESLGLPVVRTAVSLGKRLSKYLDKQR